VENNAPPLAIAGILLAAGFSRRFGVQDKLLALLPNGLTVAESAAQALITALPISIAVVRDKNETLAAGLRSLGYHVVYCTTDAQTMADSLHLGVLTAQSAFPSIKGIVIALADMPFIQPETILRVAEHLPFAAIVQPTINGQRGHPVGFSSDLIEELLAVNGDQGAREVLRAHADEVLLLPCEDAGILQDIDTPADLN